MSPVRRRPITLDDVPGIVRLLDLALSPDGRRVAVTLETADEARNALRRRIALIDLGEGRDKAQGDGRGRAWRPRTIVRGGSKLGSPAWSPDGSTIAFLSDRSGTRQVWLASPDEDRPPERLTDRPTDVSDAVWSPDGTRLAFVAAGADRAGEAVPVVETDPRRRIIRVRGHRHRLEGHGYLDGPRSHVWVLDIAERMARQVTDGVADDAQPAWSPDGRSIAFMSDRSADRDVHFGSEALHVVDVESSRVRRLSPEGLTAALPAWSPDGRHIAYLRRETPHDVDDHDDRLWVVAVATGTARCISADIDRSVGFRPGGYRTSSPPAWAADGSSIVQIVPDGGTTQLVRFPVDGTGSTAVPLTEGSHVISEFSADASGDAIAFIGSDPVTPNELWHWSRAGGVRRVIGLSDALLRRLDLPRPGLLAVERPDGFRIEGWLLQPAPDAVPAAERGAGGLPLVVLVHGGPHNAFGERFYPDQQLLAAAGYAVLTVNPRGSGSYGEAFARAVIGDWGGADFGDIVAVLDAVLVRNEPGIDPTRLAMMGGSYGGFMTCWAITRTDRFAAAIANAPLSNIESAYGTSDIGATWLRTEFGGSPADDLAGYRDRSALAFAERVETPLLLIHGEADLRVPIEQSEQFFTALTAQGRDVELIRVPGEGHVLPAEASPVHRRLIRQATVDWLDRYLGAITGGPS